MTEFVHGAALRVWDDETCARLHEATLAVLEKTGVEVHHDGALELLARAGASVAGTRARIPSALVEEALQTAPSRFEMRSRGTQDLMHMDAAHTYFGTGSDCLYVSDPESGLRRRALVADIQGMAALSELLPNIDFVMSMGLPEDVPQEIDDLAQFAAMLRGTRKPLLLSARDGRILAAMYEMAAVCGEAQSFAIYAMPAPPLSHEAEAVDKLITCGELGIPIVYASAPGAGATAPMSRAAVALSGNAETLSGLVIHQLANPGAPFIYGVAQGALNMRSSVYLYCAPDAYAVQHACCDLARHYDLPSFTLGGSSDSKVLDGQWAAETALTLVLGALSRATLVHDLGFLESGLQSSYEAIVFSDELVGYVRSFAAGVQVDEVTLALAEIEAVGPGGSYLSRRYTRRHARDYWQASLLDQWTHGHWEADGRRDLDERLRARVAELRATEPPFALSDDADRVIERALADAAAERDRRG
jgi:trimethylamine--corrinoid protein Co-methyltransferase